MCAYTPGELCVREGKPGVKGHRTLEPENAVLEIADHTRRRRPN